MIVDNGKYYLYRHIRVDNEVPFYVGVGKKLDGYVRPDSKRLYWRANATSNRNSIWNKIKQKTDYRIEIILETDDKSFIFQKETEFIKLYGRIDIGTGSLANFTDGGEGLTGATINTINKSRETKIRTGSFLRNKEHLKKYRLPKGSKSDWVAKECFIYKSDSGELISNYRSALDCSKIIGMPDATVNSLCRKNQKYKYWVFTYINYGSSVNPNYFKEKKHLSNKVIQYSKDSSKIIKVWENAITASKYYKLHRSAVSKGISKGHTVGGYKWGWYDVLNNKEVGVFSKVWKSWKQICKIDKKTNEVIGVYKSISEAAKINKISAVAICNVLKNKSKSSGGFFWEYLNK